MNNVCTWSDTVSALKADFRRGANLQGKVLMVIVRLRRYFSHSALTGIVRYPLLALTSVFYVLYVKLLHNCDIATDVQFGPGVRLVHPYNIVIADGVVIGDECTILHEVTMGYYPKRGTLGVPRIGDNAWIFAGAKLFGPIVLGNEVRIGANAVVFEDVPDNGVVISMMESRVINPDEEEIQRTD